MKAAFKTLLALALVFVVGFAVVAEDKAETGKKVTLKGTLTCAKCGLKKEKACTNAIEVEKDGKKVVYYLDDAKGKEKYHKEICTDSKPGSVTGVVSKKGDQLYIKPEKGGVKFD